MEIKLESNRQFLFKIFVPFVFLLSTVTIGLLIYIIISSSTSIPLIISTIIIGAIDLIYISIIIVLKVKKKPIFIFNNEQITYFKKDDKITVNVNDIKTMIYVSNKRYDFILYIFIIFLGDSGGFNMPMLKIVEKNGREHLLGYFSKQDIIGLKKLYYNLLIIK